MYFSFSVEIQCYCLLCIVTKLNAVVFCPCAQIKCSESKYKICFLATVIYLTLIDLNLPISKNYQEKIPRLLLENLLKSHYVSYKNIFIFVI